MSSNLYGVDGARDSINQDFATQLWRIKALGFNTIRLGFTFDALNRSPKQVYGSDCPVVSKEEAVATITPPWLQNSGVAQTSPLLDGYPTPAGGRCSAGIPNNSIRDRYLWAAREVGKQGMYLMPDFHLKQAFKGEPDLSVYDPERFVDEWVALTKDLVAIPELKGKLLLDLVNEPDGYNLTWDSNSAVHGGADMTVLYTELMDALHPVCPDCLFLIEGSGQSNARINWGDGFIVDEAYIDEWNISNPNVFLTELLDKPYVKQVVISPHFYCPQVTTAVDYYAGADGIGKWARSNGYFQTKGYCTDDGRCRRFPLLNSEFGTGFEDDKEKACWKSIVEFHNNVGEGKTGNNAPITNWVYWLWNPDSVDTSGGLVDDTYRTLPGLAWYKLGALTGENKDFDLGLGLRPWWLRDSPGDVGYGSETALDGYGRLAAKPAGPTGAAGAPGAEVAAAG